MNKLIFTLFAVVIFTSACNSTTETEKATQDSIAAAASADSILNSAMQADSLSVDSLAPDSIKVDSIQ